VSGSSRLALRAIIVVAAMIVATVPARAAEPAALWHMDETSGSRMVDASANGNDGSLEHITFVSAGWSGGAYSFNGTNSLVVVPDDDSLDPGTRDITLEAHIKVSSAPTQAEFDYDIVRKKGSGLVYKMEVLYTGRAYCQFKGTSASVIVKGGPVVTDGTWHTITCAKTSGSVILSVDGSVAVTKTKTAGSIANAKALVLGGQLTRTEDWFEGLMDEVSVTIGS
jgi:hypothetical protein